MKKIININLYGRVIPIEDAAYDSLQRYIESLRRYFAAEEGRDEIINDIESRISELMNDKIKKGAACITEADIAEIIAAMGRVEDFEAADRDESIGTEKNTSGSSYSHTNQSEKPRFSGRLYRDGNDKFLGGVCSGIAAYTNIDPTVVRLLFAIVTFGGFGLGFLIYIVLWAVLPTSNTESYAGKRFFRNPDDRMIGGVAGGLAAYFNKNATTIRLIFAAPILLKILFSILNVFGSAFHSDFTIDVAFGSLTGTFIITYIILWIVLPEARTPYDKMEMRGEKIDVNRIKQNVQEGMGDFKTRAKEFSEEVKTAAHNLSNRAKNFTGNKGLEFVHEGTHAARNTGNSIGHAIGVMFKSLFLFVAGVIAFGLFVVLLVFAFSGVARPINDFLLDGFWQKTFMWGTIIFFLAVPLLAVLTSVIRRAMKVRSQNRYIGWTFGGLWALGWVCLPLFVASMVKDFRFVERTETPVTVAHPYMNKMLVQVPGPAIRYSGNFAWINMDDNETGWDVTDDSLKLSHIRINIKQSEDSQYHVTMFRYGAADNRNKALQRAEKFSYEVKSIDSVLQLDSGFGLSEADKYRGQKVMVEIKVPVGKQIRFDNSVADKLNGFNIRIGETERYNRNRYWNRRHYDFDWDNNYYQDWEPDTDYYMTADGKLKEVSASKNDGVSPEEQMKKDTMHKRGTVTTDFMNDDEEENKTTETGEETTMKKPASSSLRTPMSMPFIPTLF